MYVRLHRNVGSPIFACALIVVSGVVGLGQINLPVRTLGLGEIQVAAYSPDLRYAAFAEGNIVYLISTSDWTVVFTLEGHSDSVTAVAFSSDGQMLASGSRDQTIHLWNVLTGEKMRILQGDRGPIRCIAFSPDGHLLAAGAQDSAIHVWDITTGSRALTLRGHANYAASVAFSPDSRLLASGSSGHTIKLWDLASGQELRTFHGHTSRVTSITFSSDGSLLASAGGSDGTVRLWDVATGWEIRTLRGHCGAVTSVALSPDSKLVVAGVWEPFSYRGYVGEAIVLWSVTSGEALVKVKGEHFPRVCTVAFDQDGRVVVWAEQNLDVGMLDVASRQVLYWSQIQIGHKDPVWSLAFSPDGTMLASGPGDMVDTTDTSIILWDVATGRELRRFRGHSTGVTALAFSPDGRMLASAQWVYGEVKVWDVETGKQLLTLSHDYSVYAVVFSPDGELLATGGRGPSWTGEVRLWNVLTGQQISVFKGHTREVHTLAFSPDGRLLASGADDATVKLWMVETGWVRTLRGHENPVVSVVFSPDGKRLISSDLRSLIIWDVDKGEEITRITIPSGYYTAMAFSPDTQFFVVSKKYAVFELELMQTETVQVLSVLTGHMAPVRAVVFSPNGRLLASGGDDEKVKLWDVSSIISGD